ncbi:hypothetical protein RB620_23090 [Paenibacillus sp. LHD-117]|uniref:hypothetical protein n=1 Tax=Paenibacillus sp. LHD-117 TaxID=3071412 RepID=UPI0027E1D7FB|nr:hypothetical protein [Paenibacillus sp. LHD-117]MDQ6422319.1 hypothetical protein [Paenibacillus sp. LHD-117]
MYGSESTTVSRCSLVVRTTDIWTGRPAAPSSLLVRLKGGCSAPMRTSEGSWAFLDLKSDTYEITVESAIYMSCSRKIDLSSLQANNPVVDIFLLPGKRYSPPAAATGIVRRLVDPDGKPLPNVEVVAYADDDQAARGRILDEESSMGSGILRCLPGASAPKNGDALAVRGHNGSAAEWFRVQPFEDEEGMCLRPDRPLAGLWKRNALLLPAAATVSDRDGWIVLPFRGRIAAAGEVRVRLRDGERTAESQWSLKDGQTIVLPDFVWQPGG